MSALVNISFVTGTNAGSDIPSHLPVPALKPVEQRIWDMVLYSEADRELVPLRIAELAGKVDFIVFAETEFRFANGELKPSAFDMKWLELGPHVRYYRIRRTGLELCAASALKIGGSTHVHDAGLRKRAGLVNSKCRESFGRNALTQAFDELGGRNDDIVMISDADEMPRAAALEILRRMVSPSSRRCLHLGAVHHFKYTLRCERGWRAGAPGATWLKGPTVTTGGYLREVGAQSVRTMDGCVEAGYGPAKCVGPLKRFAIANASWHISSMSGGVEGVVRKMRDNAANAMYDGNEMLFMKQTVVGRANACKHGESAKSRGAANYDRTPWNRDMLPRYPSVPLALENAFHRHELMHFLGWEDAGDRGLASTVWETPREAPIHLIRLKHPWLFRQTTGNCNMSGCFNRLSG